jgi:hypothetical protein
MRWPWRLHAKQIEPRPMVVSRVMELQTAKEILAEVFHARSGEVKEMILRRLSFLGGSKLSRRIQLRSRKMTMS